MSEISTDLENRARPDIVAEVDEFGARLIIRQGESSAVARPTPEGALDLATWLRDWALKAIEQSSSQC
ncbi:hypothetical protein ACLBYG_21890 [Methylobacterium sp. D53M]